MVDQSPDYKMNDDTIAAIATAQGRGSVGIVRVSGDKASRIATALLGKCPEPRYATYQSFKYDNELIDEGIALFFKGPNSFTGEDVLELQGHGGTVVLHQLLNHVLQLGARLAEPGEFSKRAFLNNKLDLIQVEAIASLIDASSQQAAKAAMRSLQGEFSTCIHQLRDALINLRVHVESGIDFSDQDIDFASDPMIVNQLDQLFGKLETIQQAATQDCLLQEGMTLVILGPPNAGKSSLLNVLSGDDIAIVTELPGTTRDLIQQTIHIEGLPVKIIDTAGLRETNDPVEQLGIEKAKTKTEQADCVIWIEEVDKTSKLNQLPLKPDLIIRNKIDKTKTQACFEQAEIPFIYLSVKTGEGISLLNDFLKEQVGFQTNEGVFSARKRHLIALETVKKHLEQAKRYLSSIEHSELLAEELRLTQIALNQITGEFSSDDLLGEIFSTFCIGK